MGETPGLVPVEAAELRIRLVRGINVILDSDLAALYAVETRALIQAVRRNPGRFPPDFTFELTPAERTALKSEARERSGRGGRRTLPIAFTEQGVAMLSSVLRSPRAVAVNVQIMRAFVRLREIFAENADLSRRLDEMEQRYDAQSRAIIDAIQRLTAPPVKPRHPLGFRKEDEDS